MNASKPFCSIGSRMFVLPLCLWLAACSEAEPPAIPSAVAASAAAHQPLCEIDDNSIGGIPLGTSLEQVRQSFPHAVLTPVTDAEGVGFTMIKLNPDVEIAAYTGAPENPAEPITYLDTASKACKTAQGVHPEMLLEHAEQRYGAVEQIVMSEIESRQTADFTNQPPTLSFRIDDSGAFDEEDGADLPKITTEYQEGAKIHSIAVFPLPEAE